MRYLIIILLAGLCAWLVKERITLKEEVASLTDQLQKKQKEVDELQPLLTGVQPGRPGAPGSARRPGVGQPGGSQWIQEHVERGARALDPKR